MLARQPKVGAAADDDLALGFRRQGDGIVRLTLTHKQNLEITPNSIGKADGVTRPCLVHG